MDAALTDRRVVERLATRYLSAELAERWLALLRPAVLLVPAVGSDPVVARLGGEPVLPDSIAWPTWPGHGPLTYVGEIRCAELSRFELDIPVPPDGRFLFFCFDASSDGFASIVVASDAETRQGACALYVPDSPPGSARGIPQDARHFNEMSFYGLSIITTPPWEHPDLADIFAAGHSPNAFAAHVPDPNAFANELWATRTGVYHQIGGYPDVMQGRVEEEVAMGVLPAHERHDMSRVHAEARRWKLFVQFDTDVRLGMMWGDSGLLYWLARQDDLDQYRFDRLAFASQSA